MQSCVGRIFNSFFWLLFFVSTQRALSILVREAQKTCSGGPKYAAELQPQGRESCLLLELNQPGDCKGD